jgi:hypothetical protein
MNVRLMANVIEGIILIAVAIFIMGKTYSVQKMKTDFSRLVPSFVAFALLLSGAVTPAIADGGIWHYGDDNRMYLAQENAQVAAINYQDGLERMLISVNYNGENVHSVWIFPVPARPSKVGIDVVSSFPSFSGTNPEQTAKSAVGMNLAIGAMTQIYPLVLGIPFLYIQGGMMAQSMNGFGDMLKGVQVWESIEKDGIRTELITTESGDSLYNYLRAQGLFFDRDTISIFNGYIGKDYSFVVSWITSQSAYGDGASPQYYPSPSSIKHPGILITFPTDKIFFPLMPTSVYGSAAIPIRLYVMGFVQPQTFGNLGSYVTTQYYTNSYSSLGGYGGSSGEMQKFFGTSTERSFTKVEILDAPAKYFTDDLWFNRGAPARITLSSGVNSVYAWNPLVVYVIVIAAMSALAGAVTARMLKMDVRRYALIGLSNMLTIIGLWVVVSLTPSGRAVDESYKKRLKEQGFSIVDTQKFRFIPVFSVVFILLSIAAYLAMSFLL